MEKHLKHIKLYENKLIPGDIKQINYLLKQLSPNARTITWKNVKDVMKNGTVFVLRDHSPHHAKKHPHGLLIGKTLLLHNRKMISFYGIIDDVIVDEEYRGMGLGKILTANAIKKAKKLGMKHIDLTSRPHRVAANNLYQKIGFKKRDTNVYRLDL